MIPTYYAGGERPLTPDDISQSEAKIIEQIIIKSPTIPAASVEELGKVRMFTGETDAVYTHGYIYECVEDNNVYSWERIDVQPVTDLTSLENRVTAIEDVVPAQATAQNQLADKAFVNSSISTNTANFIGTFNSVADLEAYSGTVTNNDYAFVTSTDSAGNTLYNRYKYNGTAWVFEYALNNSGFTASQWAAINSGATAAAIASMQTTSNLVTSISSSSTDTQYPSAKCVYDIVGNIETLLQGV